jgi:hypothetical protein
MDNNPYKPRTLDHYIIKYGPEEGLRRYNKRNSLISKSRYEPHWQKFIRYPGVQDIIGSDVLSDSHKEMLEAFFTNHNWKKHRKLSHMIAHWVSENFDNWEVRYSQLRAVGITSTSLEAHIIKYGEIKGRDLWNKLANKKRKLLPSNREYYHNKGLTEEQITEAISVSQKQKAQKARKAQKEDTSWKSRHPGFVEYWLAQGMSQEQATQTVSDLNRRDLDYYQAKYGEQEGIARFENIKSKRKQTWQKKDKLEHAIKTTPGKFNPKGTEYRAIEKFILANNIDKKLCKYGSPKDQFWQIIPGVGFRRYDLAVFEDENHTQLRMIMEYHGPSHINFSDYTPDIKDVPITIKRRNIYWLGTYGASYENDMAKRNHIIETYPHVCYLVMWEHDLKAKRFMIDDLQRR